MTAMHDHRRGDSRFLSLLLLAALACGQLPARTPAVPSSPAATPAAGTPAGGKACEATGALAAGPIRIGVEYVPIDNQALVTRLAGMLAPLEIPAAKPLPLNIEWGEMQRSPGAATDFRRLDAFVGEFQTAGFSDLVLSLKSHNRWAASDPLLRTSVVPRAEYLDDYAAWVGAVVERYDGDGRDDLPGLARPVRIYEIGSEFSSYEPEPVADYLVMLERAYCAAHRADPEVLVAHAALLTTTAFKDHPDPSDYEAAFAAVDRRVMTHNLADIHALLDRPDVFDLVNVHALGDPYELEDLAAWLGYEMQARGYRKPIIVSDTSTTPFIAWGTATACNLSPQQMGLIIPPATEDDRCRLAGYFKQLLAGDQATLRWTQAFAAQDTVKRVVVAAEQGYALIDTAFVGDLEVLKLPVFQAAGGTGAWAGMLDPARNEYRPSYYALRQVAHYLAGYDAVQRLPFADPGVRVYQITRAVRQSWVAWYEPGTLSLPGDPAPHVSVDLTTGLARVTLEPAITAYGQTAPARTSQASAGGVVTLDLTPLPLFIGGE
jgi:hypothetical protein